MELTCTNCGGAVPIETDTTSTQCPWCGAALYVHTAGTALHYVALPQLAERDMGPLVQRELARIEITDPISVERIEVLYFPYWRRSLSPDRVAFAAAASPLCDDLARPDLALGDLKIFSGSITERARVVEPAVSLVRDADEQAAQRAALVHVPLARVAYRFKGLPYEAVVDAAGGRVFADDWPPSPERDKDRALSRLAALAFTLFFAEAALLPGILFVIPAFALTAFAIHRLAAKSLRESGW